MGEKHLDAAALNMQLAKFEGARVMDKVMCLGKHFNNQCADEESRDYRKCRDCPLAPILQKMLENKFAVNAFETDFILT